MGRFFKWSINIKGQENYLESIVKKLKKNKGIG